MMKQLVRYMLRQWIYSNTYPVSTISVYGIYGYSNSDTEDSHRILNKSVGEPHINMYKLVYIVHEMSVDLKLTCAMVSMQKINRQQKSVFKYNNHCLMELFEKYSSIDPK